MDRLTEKVLNPCTHKTETCVKLSASFEDVVNRLAEYEDLEEQGKMLKNVDLLLNRIKEKYSKELGGPNYIWYNHGISDSIEEIKRELRKEAKAGGVHMKIVSKKILSQYFEEVRYRIKNFELRKDEGDIQPGDRLILKEWENGEYTGREVMRTVLYVLRNVPEYGLMDGYCIIGF